jgi:two-component system, OmpR family, alkaline phosphatase synthesis response regulator PhoP
MSQASKILVIEDERSTRVNLINFLTAEGFEPLPAENGRIGIQLAQQHQPDLIICDILMPELDGYDVLTRLQQQTETASIPFIFLTVTPSEAGFQQSMALGADDYLSKPVSSEQLRRAIATQLKKKTLLIGEPPEPLLAFDPAAVEQPLTPFMIAQEQLLKRLIKGTSEQLTHLNQALEHLPLATSEIDRQRYLHELQSVHARLRALVNEVSSLQTVLTPDNASTLLAQFNLIDGHHPN